MIATSQPQLLREMGFTLSAHLLTMETVLLTRQQLTEHDAPFASRFDTCIDAYHMTRSLAEFTDRYLAEAADTLACRQMPGVFPRPTVTPNGVLADAIYWRGLTITMHGFYDHPADSMRLAFRAVYHLEPAWRGCA